MLTEQIEDFLVMALQVATLFTQHLLGYRLVNGMELLNMLGPIIQLGYIMIF